MRFKQLLTGNLKTAYNSVEKTHPRLGKLAVLELICDVANRCLLVIGTSGTGKSAVLKAMMKTVPRRYIYLDTATASSLQRIQDRLDRQNLTILVDDISKGGTEWSEVQTVLTFGELCYTGFFKKYTFHYSIEIEDFKGAAIINAQPLILKRLLAAPEFESNIRDKTIRYYHLPRPQKPLNVLPQLQVKYEYDISNVEIPKNLKRTKAYRNALKNFQYEFTKARANEHLDAMVKATARLQNRTIASKRDILIVEQLSRNFLIEAEIFSKQDLEGPRTLDVNALPLLSIIASYKTAHIDNLMVEFQVKRARMYEIIKENAHLAQFNESILIPTAYTIDLLKQLGEW